MNRIERLVGKACDECLLCRYAKANPSTTIGKIMTWHGKWCPAWKAQQEIERERRQLATRKEHLRNLAKDN